ncbi:hypothetical protein HaLaN_00615, partial [Haematococcus lacustris]
MSSKVLLGHVGRGGLSRRGPLEQNWHEFECQDLSRHSTQHSAQYLMTQAAPHSWRSPLSSDELNINRIHVAETRRRFDYQGSLGTPEAKASVYHLTELCPACPSSASFNCVISCIVLHSDVAYHNL